MWLVPVLAAVFVLGIAVAWRFGGALQPGPDSQVERQLAAGLAETYPVRREDMPGAQQQDSSSGGGRAS